MTGNFVFNSFNALDVSSEYVMPTVLGVLNPFNLNGSNYYGAQDFGWTHSSSNSLDRDRGPMERIVPAT